MGLVRYWLSHRKQAPVIHVSNSPEILGSLLPPSFESLNSEGCVARQCYGSPCSSVSGSVDERIRSNGSSSPTLQSPPSWVPCPIYSVAGLLLLQASFF